jgi:hypothetical protein
MMNGSDIPYRAALGAHDYGLGNSSALGIEHAAKQLATGNACRGEEYVIALDQVVYSEYRLRVYAGSLDAATLTLVTEKELALHIAAKRL